MRSIHSPARLLIPALALLALTGVLAPTATPADPSDKKPNVLVIFGDDIGQSNISAYTHGLPRHARTAKQL